MSITDDAFDLICLGSARLSGSILWKTSACFTMIFLPFIYPIALVTMGCAIGDIQVVDAGQTKVPMKAYFCLGKKSS